jgi:molybdopterin/thiamine biosynthesis adenylyltransferase
MREVTLPSGRVAVINPASLGEALDLKEAVFDAISKVIPKDGSVQEIIGSALCTVQSSKDVRSAMSKCFLRCTINKEKVTPEMFDGKFEDYATLEMEVFRENFLPFTEGLLSSLGTLVSKLAEIMENLPENYQ